MVKHRAPLHADQGASSLPHSCSRNIIRLAKAPAASRPVCPEGRRVLANTEAQPMLREMSGCACVCKRQACKRAMHIEAWVVLNDVQAQLRILSRRGGTPPEFDARIPQPPDALVFADVVRDHKEAFAWSAGVANLPPKATLTPPSQWDLQLFECTSP